MAPKFTGLRNNQSLLFQGLKTIKFYDLAVSILSQELEFHPAGLAGWFSPGVTHTAAVKITQLQSRSRWVKSVEWLLSGGLTRVGGPFAQWLTYLYGKFVLVVDRKPWFPGMLGHLQRERDPKQQGGRGHVLSGFASEVTPGLLPYSRQSQRTTLVQCGRRVHQGVNTRKSGSLGTILRVGYHSKELIYGLNDLDHAESPSKKWLI